MKALGSNNNDLVEMNRSAIVRILQQMQVCSRADIAKITGLTQASITKIVAVLIDMGIVSEVGVITGDGNRRSIGLRLNSEKKRVIGVKFGRHVFAIGVFDISGKLYTQKETPFELTQDTGEVIASMKLQIRQLLNQYEDIVAIGLALPGPYLRDEGRIAMVTHMQIWHSINFVEEFKNEFDKPVFIEQDANAGALAEWWFGNHGRPLHTLAYFLTGEGVGSGIVCDGKLLLGMQGTASEIGHISIDFHGPLCECGNRGCLELYCSAPAMLKRAESEISDFSEKTRSSRANACDAVFEMARQGKRSAIHLVNDIAAYIGYGCVALINAYNPDIIVIGDILASGRDLMLPVIHKIVNQRTISELHDNVKIMFSELAVDPTLYGAAAIATDRVLRRPSEYLAKK